MESKKYLSYYQLILGATGLPEETLATGGGRAFKAIDTRSDEEVTLEMVPAAGLPAEVIRQVEAEADTAKQLEHINIPKVHDFGVEDDQLIYVTEFFDGTTAEAWVAEHGPMAISAVLRIAQQVVAALGAAAFHGIFNHALSPRTVLLVPGQTSAGEWPLIKVLSFIGLAPDVSDDAEGSGGAVDFASPEQIQNGPVDFRSELYSLGATMWFLLTGAAPSSAAGVRAASGVSGGVKQLIAQMLAVDPTHRPLDPLALQQQIQNCLAQVERRDAVATKFGLPPAAAKTAAPVSKRKRRHFSTRQLALAALLLGLAMVTAIIFATDLRPSRLFVGNEDPLGVPIGVPDAQADRPSTAAALPARAPLTNAPSSDGPRDETSGPALVSRSAAPADEAEQTPVAPPSAKSPRVAMNPPSSSARAPSQPPLPVAEAASVSQASGQLLASNSTVAQSREPMPPSEGPDEAAATPPALNQPVASEAQSTDIASASSTQPAISQPLAAAPVAQQDVVKPEVAAKPRPPKTEVAKSIAPPKKDVRVARENGPMPRLPRGAVRAEFLGTTRDGDLVFGLPSSQRGYVAAPEASRSQRRGRRPATFPPDVQVLPALPPVLPALPPDEE